MPYIGSWSLGAATDKIDVTAFGDVNKTVVPGLPDASGEFGGFFDDSSNILYNAAIDGLDRAMYLYATANNTANYWYGRIFVDASFSGSVDGAVEATGTWAASGAISFK